MKKVIPREAVLVPDEAKCVYTGIIFDVYQWEQQLFDHTYATYEMVKRLDSINAICIVNDKIVILDEEQPHQGSRLSFPLGKVDRTDQSTLVAAKREVSEEIGYSFSNWRLVQVRQYHKKIEWFIYTYLAWGVEDKKSPQQEGGEKIKMRLESLEKVKAFTREPNDFLGWSRLLFEKVDSIEDLLNLPTFKGQEVDR